MKKETRSRIEKITNNRDYTSKIWIPHEDKEIGFIYPSICRGDYKNLGKTILKQGLSIPTGDYTSSLLYEAYCGSEEFRNSGEAQQIRASVDRWLWVFNQTLWTSKGVYVVHDLDAMGRNRELDSENLDKQLEGNLKGTPVLISADGRIRFAPKDSYKLGEHTLESLAKDGFVIASYGVIGAKRLAEVSTKFDLDPYVMGIDVSAKFNDNVYPHKTFIKDGEKIIQGISGISGNGGSNLLVSGDYFEDRVNGHAFSVVNYLYEFDPRNGSLGPFMHFLHFFPTKDEKFGTYRFGFKGIEICDLISDASKIKTDTGSPDWIPVFVDLDKYLIQNNITVDETDRQRKIYCEDSKNETLEQKSQREGRVVEFFKPILQHLVEEKDYDPEFLFA